MISTSAIRHLNGIDPSGKLALTFFEKQGNFIMNGTKGSEGFSQGWRAFPTATFTNCAALKSALEAGC